MAVHEVILLNQKSPIIISSGLVPKGTYAAGTNYAVGDSVDYQGSSYVMFNDAGAGTLPTDTAYWQVLANKGDDGATGTAGADGEDGSDAYVYIAYASADDGTDFTTTFDEDLDYIAVKNTITPIVTPQVSDFSGLWKNYKGEKGEKGDKGDTGTSGHTIKDEGTALTSRLNLNFVGAGVIATDDSGNDATVVTIPQTDLSGQLHLDQTTPQEIINGKPKVQGFQFNTNPTVGDFAEGKMYYDTLWKTMSLNIDTDVTLNIGQETQAYCKNNTGSNIVNGQVVYITGADGGYPTIDLADATDVTKSFVLGVVTTGTILANGGFGHVTIRGHVNDLVTNAWATGTTLYLSDTTPGALTSTAPSAGNYDVRVGRVMISNNGAGRIYVNIRPMMNLTDLGDVTISSPVTDNILKYNGAEWVNGNQTSVGGGGDFLVVQIFS